MKPKEHKMQTCGCGGKICNGIIQESAPRKIINGVVYGLPCGFKKEKENDLLCPVPRHPDRQENNPSRR